MSDSTTGENSGMSQRTRALQGWLEDSVKQAPSARRSLRVLAGAFVLAVVLIIGYELWRSGGGALLSVFSSVADFLVALTALLLLLVFATVSLTGSVPLWLWRVYLRACGRL